MSISLFVELIFSVKLSKASWATLNSSIPSTMVSTNALYPVAISGSVMVLNLALILQLPSLTPLRESPDPCLSNSHRVGIGVPLISVNSLSRISFESPLGSTDFQLQHQLVELRNLFISDTSGLRLSQLYLVSRLIPTVVESVPDHILDFGSISEVRTYRN